MTRVYNRSIIQRMLLCICFIVYVPDTIICMHLSDLNDASLVSVFGQSNMPDSALSTRDVHTLLVRVWSKLDLLHAFHLDNNVRMQFARDIVDEVLYLYAQVIALAECEVHVWDTMRDHLKDRLTVLVETTTEVFPACLSDEIGTIRYVCDHLVKLCA
jgi:hypothetical protein